MAISTRQFLLKHARTMRSNPTRAERILWRRLRNKQLRGYKFRRQHVLEPYIVDFYCAEKKLVIELDGSSHGKKKEADDVRQLDLEERYGVVVLRFGDEALFSNLGDVLEEILRFCSI